MNAWNKTDENETAQPEGTGEASVWRAPGAVAWDPRPAGPPAGSGTKCPGSRRTRCGPLAARFAALGLSLALTGFRVSADETPPHEGRHFFIAQEHPAAADDNPGTKDLPFKTLEGGFARVAGVIRPGDTVWIREGVYRHVNLRLDTSAAGGALVFPSGDGYSRMISIQAYPGERPVINQSLVVEGWSPFQGEIWTAEFPGTARHVSPVVFLDGFPLRQIGGTVCRNPEHWDGPYGDGMEDMEAGSFYFDREESRLYVWLEDGADPNDHLLETYADGARLQIVGELEYIRVSRLTIRYGGITLASSRSLFEDIDQAWAPFVGCHLGGEYNTMVRSRFNHNGNSGMGGRGRGHRILDSETNHNNWRGWNLNWHAGGVKFIPFWHDVVLKGHVAAYNNGHGIWFDARMSNVTIESCRAYRNRGHGIHYEIGTRGVIKNNLVYENEQRGIYLSNAAYTAVLHNVVYRNGMSGIVAIGVERRGGVSGRGPNQYVPAGHNVVWGNILMDNCWEASRDRHYEWMSEHRPELIMPSDREGNEGNVSDFNLFYRTGGRGARLDRLAFGRNWNVTYALGLEAWREATGWDRHSKVADPRFVDASAYDFRLAGGSPALWMVSELDDSMRFDYEGTMRSRQVHSAGPFEGDLEELARMLDDPPSGPHRLFPLRHRSGQAGGQSIRLAHAALRALRRDSLLQFGMGLTGVEVLELPFRQEFVDLMTLDADNRSATLPLGDAVHRLHVLFFAENARAGQPLAEARIRRGDGQMTRLVWEPDGKDGWTMQPASASARPGAVAADDRMPRDPPELRLHVASWVNENPWLPLEDVEVRLLDPEAVFGILGVTGETSTP